MKGLSIGMVIGVAVIMMTLTIIFVIGRQKNILPPFEGTYIRFSQHEFGSEWDTVAIRRKEGERALFQVQRRWKYERLLDGRVLQPEYKRSLTSGQWLDKERMMVEEESGVRYLLDEKKAILFVATTAYQKIK